MDRSKFISGMNSDVSLSEKERRRIIRKSVAGQHWKLKCTVATEELAELAQVLVNRLEDLMTEWGFWKRWQTFIFAWNFSSVFLKLRQRNYRRRLMLNYSEKEVN